MPPALFVVGYIFILDRVSCFCLGQPRLRSSIYGLPQVCTTRTRLFVQIGSPNLFAWTLTKILLISTPGVARIRTTWLYLTASLCLSASCLLQAIFVWSSYHQQ
jgi:hypothetical protein